MLIKLLLILVILIIFYKLYKDRDENLSTDTEGFQNIDYVKLKETYIEPSEKPDLELLYSNYTGNEAGNDIWKNKTLDQCTDICNQLDNCIGFSRDLVNDDAPANCYPRAKLSNCHSNRKGTLEQSQNAIKFNSYIKSTVPKIFTKCIGDTDLTLNKSIFIKSLKYPKKYIGTQGDGITSLIDINEPDFNQKCNFRIEIGKDGIGTVSFLHIDSNKYLYRDSSATNPTDTDIKPTEPNSSTNNDMLILKSIGDKTSDKQRVSFNILDAMKNSMKFKCLSLDGETVNKYITINPNNNNYLACVEINNTDPENYTFMITDEIVRSKIINSKNNLSSRMEMDNKNSAENKREKFQEVNNETPKPTNLILDSVDNIPLYQNLFKTPENINIQNYVNDKYNPISQNNTFMSVNNKYNDVLLNKTLSRSITKNEEEYDNIKKLNNEIEREIANLNMGVNGKNDKLTNNIQNMRISDMANMYFTLKNIEKQF